LKVVASKSADTVTAMNAPSLEGRRFVAASAVEVEVDGRLRLEQTWAWESREGSGTSVVEEIVS
ncbi:MAG TPA: hypothetical protein VN108_02895, partial [Marmoricola sp.]|nr:hypothetical protein [Marmoricola sp.]